MPQTQTPSQSFRGASRLAIVRAPRLKTIMANSSHSNSVNGCAGCRATAPACQNFRGETRRVAATTTRLTIAIPVMTTTSRCTPKYESRNMGVPSAARPSG